MKEKEVVVVLDFGGQFNQLIARRVRELGVYCEMFSYKESISNIKKRNVKGIILSGGPSSIFDNKPPKLNKNLFNLGIPILGICYGMQLIAKIFNGEIENSSICEYGKRLITLKNNKSLFLRNIKRKSISWMSHKDQIKKLPKNFIELGSTETTPYAIIANEEKLIYGVQFHPEVKHTEYGEIFIKNFILDICKCKKQWILKSFIDKEINKIKIQVGANKKVLCALSGGVDSAVAAIIAHKAIDKNLTCMFIDHGLLRKNEKEYVEKVFKEKYKLKIITINAKNIFLKKLKGESDPEKKRKIIGKEFIRVFENESKKIGNFDFLIQGTLYSDIIESGINGSDTIKSHHNVGGLPRKMKFSLIEPLKWLFKDEVRKIGKILGIHDTIINRQPFPGPGLGIRILGEITKIKLLILQHADAIVREEIENYNKINNNIWQFFAILLNSKSVGVMGDKRTYSYIVAVRAVESFDGMTADWAKIPYIVLEKISTRIVNEVKEVNRVVYDITSKPPGTIEWE